MDDERPEKSFLSIQELDFVCAASIETLDVFKIIILPISVTQRAVISVAHLTRNLHKEILIGALPEVVSEILKFVYVVVLHIGLNSRMGPWVYLSLGNVRVHISLVCLLMYLFCFGSG